MLRLRRCRGYTLSLPQKLPQKKIGVAQAEQAQRMLHLLVIGHPRAGDVKSASNSWLDPIRSDDSDTHAKTQTRTINAYTHTMRTNEPKKNAAANKIQRKLQGDMQTRTHNSNPPSPPKSAKKSQQISGTNRRTSFSAKQVPSAPGSQSQAPNTPSFWLLCSWSHVEAQISLGLYMVLEP